MKPHLYRVTTWATFIPVAPAIFALATGRYEMGLVLSMLALALHSAVEPARNLAGGREGKETLRHGAMVLLAAGAMTTALERKGFVYLTTALFTMGGTAMVLRIMREKEKTQT